MISFFGQRIEGDGARLRKMMEGGQITHVAEGSPSIQGVCVRLVRAAGNPNIWW